VADAEVGRGATVGCGVGSCVGASVGTGRGVGSAVTARFNVGRLTGSAAVASPTAENIAPIADQNKLPNSRMPTMPTIVAMMRPGEPSSGGRRFTNRQ
jgi:hypothetical protein